MPSFLLEYTIINRVMLDICRGCVHVVALIYMISFFPTGGLVIGSS
jgi:hypothetical protein